MEIDLSALNVVILVVAGLAAGFINAMAGAGSLLTVPALLLVGLPGGEANATNRIGVIAQSIAGAGAFKRAGKLDVGAIVPIVIPLILGAALGAWIATLLSDTAITAVLLATMLVVGVLYVVLPDVVAPPEDEDVKKVFDSRWAIGLLFLAGIYGGFVQAGIGFVLLAILGGILRYDLVRANALKITVIAVFTVVALAIFIASDLVRWVPGLILAVGTVGGALLGVRFAIKRGAAVLRWIVLVMIVVVVIQQSIVLVTG